MKIFHWDSNTDGPLTETAMVNKLEQMGYRCTCYTYPEGTFFPDHAHETDKIDAVLKGRFRISMENKSEVLESGDYVVVPRGKLHSAEVVGDEPVVSIDAIKS